MKPKATPTTSVAMEAAQAAAQAAGFTWFSFTGFVVALAFAAVAGMIGWWLYRKGQGVWTEAKAQLFTLPSFIATMITNMLLVGLIATIVFVKVRVLGHEVSIPTPTEYDLEQMPPM